MCNSEVSISSPLINVFVIETNHSSMIQIKGKAVKYGEQTKIAALLHWRWFRNISGSQTSKSKLQKCQETQKWLSLWEVEYKGRETT